MPRWRGCNGRSTPTPSRSRGCSSPAPPSASGTAAAGCSPSAWGWSRAGGGALPPPPSLGWAGGVRAGVAVGGFVLGVVRATAHAGNRATVLPRIGVGGLLLAASIGWELRAGEPMLPLHLFRSRGFTLTNIASLLMFFGMFG